MRYDYDKKCGWVTSLSAVAPRPMAGEERSCVAAPCLRPSEEEWGDPFAYMRSLRSTVEQYGAVRIVPPLHWWRPGLPSGVGPKVAEAFWPRAARAAACGGRGWGGGRARSVSRLRRAAAFNQPSPFLPRRPPFALSAERLRLRPLPQRPGELMERDVGRLQFMADFQSTMGQSLQGHAPVVGGAPSP